MNLPPLSWDIPAPFADLAVLAARLDALLVIFDQYDRLIYASAAKDRLYPFVDFGLPQTFETLLLRAWEMSEAHGIPAKFQDRGALIAEANQARKAERLEFGRRFPTELICAHLRLPSGWNAQLRAEPDRAGLHQYFSASEPTIGLTEAIRQRDEADVRAAALDCLALGIVALGPDRRIRHRNAAMAELIERRDGFDLDDAGRLIALHPDDNDIMARLVVMACMDKLSTPTAALRVRRPTPGSAHTASVSPAPGHTAVVVVAPAQIDVGAVAGVLQRDFGLTTAEADLAARIGNGQSNDDAARELGKSPETGREQVKKILRKLDHGELANRGQTGLARFVAVVGAITGAARKRGK